MINKQVHKKSKVNDRMRYEKICVYCTKEVVFFHGNKPSHCPHCGASDYIKPPTETKLFLLQEAYYRTGDQEHLSNMFILLKQYATSIIKKLLPKDFMYHFDKIEEKAQDAASMFIEYYLTHEDFKVEKSFGGYLQWKVKEVLWNKKLQKEEDHASLNEVLSAGTSQVEFIDIPQITNIQPLHGSIESHTEDDTGEKIDLVDGIKKIIDQSILQLKQIGNSQLTNLLVLTSVCLLIEGKTEVYMDKFYHRFGSNLKPNADLIKLLIYRFIKEQE